ncbi:hypothetical protein ISP14_02935 [Dyella agri]|uniref:Uncharacterized protein n=1 Tax=Dyella agri TaxID=1926869 RepID=A0ABW8KC95_9GAMM
MDDLRRNAEYLLLEGRTGATQVEFTALCAYRHNKLTRYKWQIPRDLNRAKSAYERYVKLSCLDRRIEWDVIPFTASQELLDDSVTQDEYDDMRIHHHVGIIVVLRRSGG